MKVFAEETLSTSPAQLLVNLQYIHISCLKMALRCTQATMQRCFGGKKPQLEERLCTLVQQTIPWQQLIPQKLSLLVVSTVDRMFCLNFFGIIIDLLVIKCAHRFISRINQGLGFISNITAFTVLREKHWETISRI